eukprot:364481-Chlamydomonas_euryale.AAC.8
MSACRDAVLPKTLKGPFRLVMPSYCDLAKHAFGLANTWNGIGWFKTVIAIIDLRPVLMKSLEQAITDECKRQGKPRSEITELELDSRCRAQTIEVG